MMDLWRIDGAIKARSEGAILPSSTASSDMRKRSGSSVDSVTLSPRWKKIREWVLIELPEESVVQKWRNGQPNELQKTATFVVSFHFSDKAPGASVIGRYAHTRT